MELYMYLITRKDGTVSGVNNTLFRSFREAEDEAFGEFRFDNSSYDYDIEKAIEDKDETTYRVYARDLYSRHAVGKLSYIIHIITMQL
ncbi:MAG: hypothetical protein J5659_03385 [Clostridia bacterium]|nr:hypothetical protein [Clostridia bacterium]